MKKLLFVLAITGIITACKSKKTDEKTVDETVAPGTTKEDIKTNTTEPTTTTSLVDIPTFADPEVQKFVNDYTAFVLSYKKGVADPAQVQAMQKSAQEWSAKMIPMAMKFASNPEELKKWQTWAMALANEMKGVAK